MALLIQTAVNARDLAPPICMSSDLRDARRTAGRDLASGSNQTLRGSDGCHAKTFHVGRAAGVL
jgi:hypothetical protein